ncbi:MAG: cohesin domain-containing protein [Patescibacteria group bacterium]
MFARCALVVSLVVLGSIPLPLFAASLDLSGSGGAVGSTISVPVRVSAGNGESLNAVSAHIVFPPDKLSLVSVSKTGSIITLWAQEPTYSNTAGTVSFEGVVPNPGYAGQGGMLVTLSFRVRAPGTATLSFAGSSVLANDGQGTEILRSATSRVFALTQTAALETSAPVQAVAPTSVVSSGFLVKSLTHPEQDAWYRETTGSFSWQLPEGVTATRLLLSRNPSSVPSVVYDTPLSSKTIEGMPEGTSYLLVQHKVAGEWGAIGRYRINIDTTLPKSFRIVFPHGESDVNPQPIILFNTIDTGSGIERYEVKIGDGGSQRMAAAADSNPYTLPLQEPGSHVVTVIAYDAAGNTQTASAEFFIEGIDAPIITYYQSVIEGTDLVKVRGTTYPNSDINAYIYEDAELVAEEFTRSNTLGDFAFVVAKRLTPGTYSVTARVTDARGARSAESEPVTVVIKSKFLREFGDLAINHPLIISILALILLGLVIAGVLGVCAVTGACRKLPSIFGRTEKVTKRSFAHLKRDLSDHLKGLHSRGTSHGLTKEELLLLKQLRSDLDKVERVLGGKIKDEDGS